MSITDTTEKKENLTTPLCRYVPFCNFCEMLFFQCLTLVSPEQWNDKYENYVMSLISQGKLSGDFVEQIKKENRFNDEQVEEILGFAKDICKVAQCLCFSQSIDAEVMWNAYKYGNEAIMWITTDEKIKSITSDYVLAKVDYDLETIGINGFLDQFSTYNGDVALKNVQSFLSHKRQFFQYENEWRIIDMHFANSVSKTLSFKIPSLSDFIDGVMVHPQAEERYVRLIKQICEHFGVKFIGKSQIYEMKEIY